ncbi:hypothetical protein Tco_0916830, partial [Tanacetum coccineum]
MITDPTKTQKELTYQVVLDALALTTCYPTFLITINVPEIYMQQFWFTINKKDSTTYRFKIDKRSYRIDMEVFREIFQICPRLPNQDFDELPSDEEIVSFIKELGHKGDIKSITKVVVDHMYQPWRTFGMFYKKNVDFVELLLEDFTFQIESRDHKKQEKIILGTMRFVSKSDDFHVYGALLLSRMTTRQMRESDAYKNYLTYATCEASPKMKRKYKKPASPSKKRTLVTVEEEEHKPAKKVIPFKKPVPKRQSAGVRIQDTPDVSVSKKKAPAKSERSKVIDLLSDATLLKEVAHLKKALKRSKRDTNIHQAGGSGEGADFKSEVPDEPKGKSSNTSKGTGLKPGVPDMSKADSSESGNDEEETQDDEFVHTPKDYVPTDDETNDESNDVTEEEYERINEELYGDVNVSLTDVKPADKEKYDEEMIVASHDTVYQEGTVVSMLDINVQHEASCTSPLLTIPVFVIPEPNVINPSKTITTTPAPTISSLLSSLYPAVQQIAQIPTPTTTQATTSTTVVLDFKTLTAIHQRVSNLDKEVKILKEVDHKSKILAAIKSEVPTVVKEYLGTSLDDSIHKTALDEFDMKKALFDSMHASKSFNKTPTNKTLYHALMESLIEDENAMDQGV